MVAPANNTVAYIRRKVRHLTSSPGESSLRTATIDEFLNNFYTNDFAYGIKLDQMRSVYTFYTEPYIDRYPLDVNYSQGVRSPVYVDGIEGNLFKDRHQFYNVWPNFSTKFQPASGDGVQTAFSFTIAGPFVGNTVTIGSVSTSGAAIIVSDDGQGNLYYRTPNPRVFVPAINTNPGIPGMSNANTANPGIQNSIYVGSVNYVTGAMAFDLALANVIPGSGEIITVRVAQYQTGRPYSVLFWNNEFTIRPIPSLVHRIDLEIYLTPTQFMLSTDTPVLNQWAKFLAYGTARDILIDRQDIEGADNLEREIQRQRTLILERQAVEEIGVPNATLFNSSYTNPFYSYWGGGFY